MAEQEASGSVLLPDGAVQRPGSAGRRRDRGGGADGGQVTGGAGSINYGGATTTINQTSQVITINWQTFSTARNETVDFNQPNNSALAINYVVGGVPSVLQGALNAEGRVYILNSAGITFTGTSHVNVGALLATTAMTIDGDPTKKIDVKGSGSGKVINQGSIQVSDGGFAILAAPYVENTGFIKADLGTIALAGTNKFTLDLRGDGLINFVVPPEAVEKIKSDGARVGVNNTGTLQARSGQVLISASVATQVVNAAVNMSGVVDASAFAPNGKGGSVLITSEGDINLSGQVSAAGAGSGAGGQIITKAVRADNIAANAMMTAAAGAAAGDQGGQIEVSGHDVLLSGNIDPGAGGTLIVDPPNFTIRNGISGAGPDFIGEKKLEKILQNGVNFVASAANMIIVQDLTDNVLQGGGGDLTLNAGNAIVFNGVNDKIVTGSGNITMTAGAGGIGIAGGFGHTVALISGAPGLDHAGNIVLTATGGGNIRVKTVTVDASGSGSQTALFLANAGGDFAATGLIDVEAVAKGPGAQTANAQIDITAHDTLTLHGLRAFASASEQGGGGNLAALAGADLTARVVNDQGNASAQAVMGGHSGLRFNALADLTVDATNAIRISGRTLVAATGDIHSVSFANANALADLDGGHINIAELDVQASGLANQVGSDLVHATANLAGDQVIIGGNAAVTAFGAAPKAGYVLAVENLDITGNAVNIGGDATARATANNANLGKSASASANLFVTVTHAGSIGTFLHGNASVGGDLTVNALALNGGGSKDADVRANLQVNARGIDVGGDVVVTANGQTLHVAGNQSSTPHATALANLTAGAGDLLIDGRFFISAIASSQNRDSVVAKAKTNMTAGGSVNIHGLVSVLANAVTDATHFFANRNGLGPPAGALASAGLVVNAGSDVDLGKVLVHANGIDHGNLQADAFANAVITAHGDIDANSFDVAALADQTNALGNFTVNGSALAGLTLRALSGDVTVAGPIDVEASVLDHGANAGFAGAGADRDGRERAGRGGYRPRQCHAQGERQQLGRRRRPGAGLAEFDRLGRCSCRKYQRRGLGQRPRRRRGLGHWARQHPGGRHRCHRVSVRQGQRRQCRRRQGQCHCHLCPRSGRREDRRRRDALRRRGQSRRQWCLGGRLARPFQCRQCPGAGRHLHPRPWDQSGRRARQRPGQCRLHRGQYPQAARRQHRRRRAEQGQWRRGECERHFLGLGWPQPLAAQSRSARRCQQQWRRRSIGPGRRICPGKSCVDLRQSHGQRRARSPVSTR